MRRILALFVFLASVFLNFTTKAQPLAPTGDFKDLKRTGTEKVSEIINPLTVKLEDGRFINLAGLDFPDLDFYEPGELSIATIKILDDFLIGQHVRIYQTKDKNKGRLNRMGHHIAHLERTDNKVWVQGLLLSLGIARTRTTMHNYEMANQMLELENNARQKKSGMWDIEDFSVLNPENSKDYIGTYQIVEGKVKNVSMRKNMLYINFGDNWRDDFTVGISKKNLKKFGKENMHPQQWGKEKLRVRGWIESYNGPFIKIDHPQRLEILSKNIEEPDKNAKEIDIKEPGNALPAYNN